MLLTQTQPAEIFLAVLLEKLTTPGVILNALGHHPTEDIYFAVAGIALGRWLDENDLSETDDHTHLFFEELHAVKSQSLHIIQSQSCVPEHCDQIH